jgi:hypothetical protein
LSKPQRFHPNEEDWHRTVGYQLKYYMASPVASQSLHLSDQWATVGCYLKYPHKNWQVNLFSTNGISVAVYQSPA